MKESQKNELLYQALDLQGGISMKEDQKNELLYQALETEKGGIEVYQMALRCVVEEDLKGEWEEYLEQTEKHHQILLGVFQKLGLNSDEETLARKVARHFLESLINLMKMALEAGDPPAAELVACECVVMLETKDHQNWQLIGEYAKKAESTEAKVLKNAYDQVEDEEDEHLYSTKEWYRELWINSICMKAVLSSHE
ncbi:MULTISPECIES: hypothetical protein [Nitrosomonas]|uniref:Rubrerythrin n=1 Tax=Nitrosomonas communis TaxID=44574 RepID=A0A5D3Y9F9_9PROT|nr:MULTISPECIES: hypothetical protein [Nitrosomonas]TYP80678.1 hypothetical protein BCL69_105524 [Nitrosomonas communis]UVS60190.1 hypothetical protein NX761_11765 [Nitrosomonas sp. PLL12]